MTQIQEQTSFLSRVNNLPFCSSQTSGRCSLAPLGGCLLSDVSTRFGTRSSLPRVRRMLRRHHRIPHSRALAQPPHSAIQLVKWSKGGSISCLISLLPVLSHTLLVNLHFKSLTHIWSNSVSDVVEPDDVLAFDAAIFMFIKQHLSPQQWYPRTLPELLTTVAAPLTMKQPSDVPVLHNAYTIAHVEFRDAGTVGLCTGNTHAHGLGGHLPAVLVEATTATTRQQLHHLASTCSPY